MQGRRFVNLGVAALALAIAAGGGSALLSRSVAAQGRGGQAPRLEVDPLWPKPFPVEKHWALGSVSGVVVDSQDHIWVVNRGIDSLQPKEKGPTLTPWESDCCFAAPQILEFDAAGTLLNSWGGPGQGYQWPQNPAGIALDAKGNVWIAAGGYAPAAARGRGAQPAAAPPTAARGGGTAAPAAPADAHVIKFSRDGKFILQIGTPGKMDGPESHDTLNAPQALAVDDAANEVYVADSGNKRIVVFDANTGAYKRHWTAAGSKPFADVMCVKLAKDGKVYACDSANNRIVQFEKNGKFLKEGVVKEGTGGFVLSGTAQQNMKPGVTVYSFGSAWDLAFSNDAQQRYLYVADGMNKTVWIVQRDTLTPVSRFGDGGRMPGLFYAVGSVAVDSKGNVYTGEDNDGKRVQKWINKGMRPGPIELRGRRMNRKRNVLIGATFVATFAALASARAYCRRLHPRRRRPAVCRCRASKSIRPSRNRCRIIGIRDRRSVLGRRAGSHLDHSSRRHALRRTKRRSTDKTGMCCAEAPPILEFDQQGNLARHWGGSDGSKTTTISGRRRTTASTVDKKGNVWIGGNGGNDGMVLKFTKEGKFLMQVGIKLSGWPTAMRGNGSARSRRCSTMRRPTRCTSPTATATSAWP